MVPDPSWKNEITPAQHKAAAEAARNVTGFTDGHTAMVERFGACSNLTSLIDAAEPIITANAITPDAIAAKTVASGYLQDICDSLGLENPFAGRGR